MCNMYIPSAAVACTFNVFYFKRQTSLKLSMHIYIVQYVYLSVHIYMYMYT